MRKIIYLLAAIFIALSANTFAESRIIEKEKDIDININETADNIESADQRYNNESQSDLESDDNGDETDNSENDRSNNDNNNSAAADNYN